MQLFLRSVRLATRAVARVPMRDRSGDRVGLPHGMRALHAEFGKPGTTCALQDRERIASLLTGRDCAGFTAKTRWAQGRVSTPPERCPPGLRLASFVEDIFISGAGRERGPACTLPGGLRRVGDPLISTGAGLQWRHVDRDHP